MKNIFTVIFILTCLCIVGCVNSVELRTTRNTLSNQSIYLYGIDDNVGIKTLIRDKFTKMGFVIKENKTEANIIVDYKYQYYYDVFHYTITYFDLFMTDKNTGEVMLKSHYAGDSPWSYEGVLDKVFDKIERELSSVK